jgi:hypothetical protein
MAAGAVAVVVFTVEWAADFGVGLAVFGAA